jgi:hypothetical protein
MVIGATWRCATCLGAIVWPVRKPAMCGMGERAVRMGLFGEYIEDWSYARYVLGRLCIFTV